MLSAPDIAILGAVALLVFGPDQLPKVARKFGSVMRDVQNTSSQFIREMERAADEHDVVAERPHLEAVPEPMLPGIEPEVADVAEAAPPKKLAEPAEF